MFDRNSSLLQLQNYRAITNPREILSDQSMKLALFGKPELKGIVDKLIGPIEEANRRRVHFISAVAKSLETESKALWGRTQLQGTGNWSKLLRVITEKNLNEMKTIKAVRFLNKLLKRALLTLSSATANLEEAVQPSEAKEPLGPYRLYAVAANIYKFLDDLITDLNSRDLSICALAKIQLDAKDNSLAKITDGNQRTLRDLFTDIETRIPKLPIKIRRIKKNFLERSLIEFRAWCLGYRRSGGVVTRG